MRRCYFVPPPTGDEILARAQPDLGGAAGILDVLLRVGTCEEGPARRGLRGGACEEGPATLPSAAGA
jgi:hypothetical protein